jgi:hypothetical protein
MPTSQKAAVRLPFKMLFPVVLVIALIAVMVVIKVTGGNAATPVTSGSGVATTVPAGVLSDVTSVSPSTEKAIGTPWILVSPAKVSGNGAVLEGADGKPEVLYVGAEFCPYCAAERWALVEALSRFGTFTHLSATHSSDTDIYPDTKTFSFYGSTYSSPYVDFVPVEEETNVPDGSGYTPLQSPTAAEESVLSAYDVAPYTTEPGSIPFVSFGDKYIVSGASYDPGILQGLTMEQIASQLNDPTSPVAIAIDGTANLITAAILAIDGGLK